MSLRVTSFSAVRAPDARAPRAGQVDRVAVEQLVPAADRERAAHDRTADARPSCFEFYIVCFDHPATVFIQYVDGRARSQAQSWLPPVTMDG